MAGKNGKPENTTPSIDTDTLRGDIRDAVLTELKQAEKSWRLMNEDEQERVITRAADIADTLVRRAVDLVAARGLDCLAITVGKFQVDAGSIKGTFEAYADDNSLLAIRHLADKRAMFVLADPQAYFGEKKPAEPEVIGDLAMPKQPDLDVVQEAMRDKARDALEIPQELRRQ